MNKQKIGFIVDSSIGLFGKDIVSEDTKQVFFNISDSDNNDYLDDNSVLTLDEIFKRFDQGKIFKTSAVSPGQVMVALEELFEKFEKVILLTVSSGLSSFYDNIKFLEEDYKDKFYVVDTKEVGYAINQLLIQAKQMVKENKSVEEIVKFCENFYKKDFTAFTCESWEPLAKSGRAPKILSKVLNTIHSRPVVNFYIKNRLGGIVIGKGEKGFQKVFEKIVEHFKKAFSNISSEEIDYIVFYNNKILESRAEYIRKKLSEIFKVAKEKIIETFVPNLVLVYTGPESFGIHIRCKKEATDRE